jgi:hypothetical protein
MNTDARNTAILLSIRYILKGDRLSPLWVLILCDRDFIETLYRLERYHQARSTFKLAYLTAGLSGAVLLTGAMLLLSGKVSEGAATSAGGLASSAASAIAFQLAKDANDRLDRAILEAED